MSPASLKCNHLLAVVWIAKSTSSFSSSSSNDGSSGAVTAAAARVEGPASTTRQQVQRDWYYRQRKRWRRPKRKKGTTQKGPGNGPRNSALTLHVYSQRSHHKRKLKTLSLQEHVDALHHGKKLSCRNNNNNSNPGWVCGPARCRDHTTVDD